MKQALYYEKMEDGKVRCFLCPHHCVIRSDGVGICKARKNVGGELYSLNYGKVTSVALDPIEKKPLNRFYPGAAILSAGTFGCNLKCPHCQNWSIAHYEAETFDVTPGQLVEKALEMKRHGNIGIAYTYNEPSIWFEYVLDTAKLAKEKGLCNVLVTNGYISEGPLEDLLPYINAMNIDVKGFTEDFYKNICKAELHPVLQTVERSAARCHVEVTTLVIPGLNDSVEEIEELAKWLASVSPEIPLHLTRFFPNYMLRDKPPTPVETLLKAKDVAQKHLKYVFLGNVRI